MSGRLTERRVAGAGSTACGAVAAAAGAGLARLAWRALQAAPPGGRDRWTRRNHRGDEVSLLEGPALAAAALAAVAVAPGMPPRARAAGLLAAGGAGLFGAVDDLAEDGAEGGGRKGLRGHVGELARGRLTTGGLKLLGISATGIGVAALLLPPEPGRSRVARAADTLVAGGVVAGTANLVNLLDLRPGRALKAVLLAAPLLARDVPAAALSGAALGPALALLPDDLAERAMLGDTGANAAGALLGAALVAGGSRRGRLAALAGLAALTLASERWSFTAVIESTPGLRQLDAAGRRPR